MSVAPDETPLRKVIQAGLKAGERASEGVDAAKVAAEKSLEPVQQELTKTTRRGWDAFFTMRHNRPWEMVTGAGLGAAVASIPFGRFAVLRNGGVALALATCIVNPEYVAQMFRNRHSYYP